MKDRFKSNQTFRFWQFLDFFNIIEGNSPKNQYGLMKFQYSVDECASGVRVIPKYPRNIDKCIKLRVKVK